MGPQKGLMSNDSEITFKKKYRQGLTIWKGNGGREVVPSLSEAVLGPFILRILGRFTWILTVSRTAFH